jgi:hypothetical protein
LDCEELYVDRDNPIAQRRRFKNSVLAALEICDENRAQESGVGVNPSETAAQRRVVETLRTLVALEAPRTTRRKSRPVLRSLGEGGKNFDEQTIENAIQ